MIAVCIVNRKGGVGKTTLTIALADFLSTLHGYRILVVDLDPQANASLALLGEQGWFNADKAKATVADLFEVVRDQRDIPTGFGRRLVRLGTERIKGSLKRVSIVPCSPRLQEIEEEMMEGDSGWRYVIGSQYFILHRALANEVFSDFDYVLIDCPPALGVATLNGLTAATGFLIPTIADHVSTIGAAQLMGRIERHSRDLRRHLKHYGTIVNRFKTGTRLHSAVLAEMQTKREFQPVWATIIPDTVKSEEGYLPHDTTLTLKGRYGGQSHNYFTALGQLAEEFIRRVS
jgi:chromosome partitioning protein